MIKSYQQPVGNGAYLGLSAPWRGTERRRRNRTLTRLQFVGRAFLCTLAFAAAVGMFIGVYQDRWHGISDPSDAGIFAYECVGEALYAAVANTMTALSLARYIFFVDAYVLVYAQIPFQLSAFAGAFFAIGGVEFIGAVLTALASI